MKKRGRPRKINPEQFVNSFMKGKRYGDQVVLDVETFDYILICLANQKYLPVQHIQSKSEKVHQAYIDASFKWGTKLLWDTDPVIISNVIY
jgi:hypothetical protein